MLEAVGISKTYRGKTVLSSSAFSLEPGELLGIAGHNGSGKTTLLSIVAQVTKPDSGDIREDGVSVMGRRNFLRRSLGYIPQQNWLLPDLTVQETLRFWQRTYGMSGPLWGASSVCSLLGLEPLAKKRVGTLSGGMQKRVSTALALMHNPRYLLMDEALPALDRHYRSLLLHWIANFRQGGGSVIYCSHETEDLRVLCDRILILQEGKTVFYGTAARFPDDQTLDRIMNPTDAAPASARPTASR